MPSDRCAHVHPDHDTHGGSVINDNDHDAIDLGKPHIFGDFPAAFAHVHDEPADVTVSDLLDARAVVIDRGDAEDYFDLNAAEDYADIDVFKSYRRIAQALSDVARLSPEERAEFDRRTT